MKRLRSFFLIICLGILLGCFVGGIIDFVPSSGVFTSWELLNSPVKFKKIVHINSDGIWVQTTADKLYFWGFFDSCFFGKPEMCYQWVETTNVPSNAYRDDHTNMSKDKDCPKSNTYPKKYPGEIVECALVFLRNGSGYTSTYFALLKDGTLWEWAPPSGTDTAGMTLIVGPFIGLILGIIVGIGYLIVQSYKVLLSSGQANKACSGRVGFCVIFKHFSGFEFFLLPSRVHARLVVELVEAPPVR